MRKYCALVLMAFVSLCCFGETLEEYLKKPPTVDQYLKEHFGFGIRAEKPEVDARMKELGFVLEKTEKEKEHPDGPSIIKHTFKPKEIGDFLLEGNTVLRITFSYFDWEFEKNEFYEMDVVCCAVPGSGAKMILTDEMIERWRLLDGKKFDDAAFYKLRDKDGDDLMWFYQYPFFIGENIFFLQNLKFTNVWAGA